MKTAISVVNHRPLTLPPLTNAKPRILTTKISVSSHAYRYKNHAHTQRFIKYPGKPAFCIACKEKEHDVWVEEYIKDEKEIKDNYEDDLADSTEEALADLTKQYDEEWKARLEVVAQDKLREYEYKEITAKDKIEYADAMEEYEKLVVENKKKGKKAPIKPAKPYRTPFDINKTEIARIRKEREAKPPEGVPEALWRANLAYCDPKGENLLPPPPAAMGEEDSLTLDGEREEGDEDEDGEKEVGLGIKIRVWNKEAGFKGTFLGQVVLDTDIMLEPPKGIRTYILKNDVHWMKKAKKKEEVKVVPINGSMTLVIKIMKVDKHNNNRPLRWKLEIQKCAHLTSVDRLKLSAPYCEVLWCGPATRDGNVTNFTRWISLGETKEKNKNLDPLYTPEDNSVFILPPVWTDLELPGPRTYLIKDAPEKGDPPRCGGWVAQNQAPVPPDMEAGGLYGAKPAKMLFRKVVWVVIVCVRLIRLKQEVRKIEIRKRLEALRELWFAQERERKQMGKEEMHARIVYLEDEVKKAKPLLERQIDYERDWSRLCQYIQSAPKILARLRFMMGSESDGGGLVLMCEDPATHRLLNVISTPIAYPEDEEELLLQMQRLVGKQNPNLVAIIDFSVHASRLYNLNGFTGLDERQAITVLERYEGETMLEYIQKEWLQLSNNDFRLLLAQIINGLVCLHDEGIVHRNIHEKSVIVRRPANMLKEELLLHPDLDKSKIPAEPNLRLGEYWFLQNPRKTGCLYSLGRADWGARSTAPPESLGAHKITDKSDMYAFGVLVYHWATGGKTIPAVFTMESLAPDLPLKWGVWVFSLLRMCLAQNPKTRASARDVQIFLSSKKDGDEPAPLPKTGRLREIIEEAKQKNANAKPQPTKADLTKAAIAAKKAAAASGAKK